MQVRLRPKYKFLCSGVILYISKCNIDGFIIFMSITTMLLKSLITITSNISIPGLKKLAIPLKPRNHCYLSQTVSHLQLFQFTLIRHFVYYPPTFESADKHFTYRHDIISDTSNIIHMYSRSANFKTNNCKLKLMNI